MKNKLTEEQVEIQQRLIKEYVLVLKERKEDLCAEIECLVEETSFHILKLNDKDAWRVHDKVLKGVSENVEKIQKIKSEIEGLDYAIRFSKIIIFEEND